MNKSTLTADDVMMAEYILLHLMSFSCFVVKLVCIGDGLFYPSVNDDYKGLTLLVYNRSSFILWLWYAAMFWYCHVVHQLVVLNANIYIFIFVLISLPETITNFLSHYMYVKYGTSEFVGYHNRWTCSVVYCKCIVSVL